MKGIPKKVKSEETEKNKAVRATYSFPKSALDDIEALRRLFAKSGYLFNHSEVVRVGLVALTDASDRTKAKAADKLLRLKAGRPKLLDDPTE
jgi:Arc/MetJ-type ribon-helix-helix transcriptional regulator